MTDNTKIPPSVAEYSIGERAQLLGRIAELELAIADFWGQLPAGFILRVDRLAALKQPSAGADERAAFEAAFLGYKAMLTDSKASRAAGHHVEQPSNMFRVWLHLRAQARASLSASRDVPEGWRLVPVEPTIDMLSATIAGGKMENRADLRPMIYRAMLAAAPSPSADDAKMVKVPVSFVRFLLGDEPIDGHSFGDARPDTPGMYWWRKQLRALLNGGRS